MRPTINFELDAKRAATVFGLITASLTVAHLVGQGSKFYLGDPYLFGFVRLFNMSEEGNIPTVYSSATLLYCSALLALIACAKRGDDQGEYHRWCGLALIFSFLSVDEACSLHEQLIAPVRSLVSASGIFYYAWVIPYGILLILLLVTYAGFIRGLPSTTRLLFLLAGGTYVAGAIGFELIEGIYADRVDGKLFAVLMTCEEILEMTGVVIFIYALMSYLAMEMKRRAFGVSFHTNAPHLHDLIQPKSDQS